MKSSRPAIGVARGASYILANSIAVTVISVAAFAIIARLISRTEMGGIAVLTLVSSGAQLLAGLGIGATVTRFVALFESAGEYEKMRQAAYECIIINATSTLALALAVYLSADVLASSLLGSMSQGTLLRWLSLEVGALGINSSFVNILYGLKRFREYSITNMTAFAIRQGLVVAFLELGWGLPGIVIGWGIGDSVNSIALGSLTRRFLGPPKLGFGIMRLFKFSAPLFLANVAGYAWTWFDRALLLPLVSLAQLGSYNVAVTAFGVLNSIPGAISGTLFPYYSHFFQDGSQASHAANLEDAVKTASRYVSLLAIPLAVGLAVTALPAATLLGGDIYADAAFPLAILAISLGVACQVNALSQIFVVVGRTVTSALVTIASVILPILVGFAIIPYLGILGASVVRGISLVISLALSISVLRRFLKIQFDTAAYGYSWIASLIMAGAVLAFQRVFYSKYLLPVYVVVGSAVFVLVLRSFHTVNRDDFELVSDFLGPRMRFVANWTEKLLGIEAKVP